MQSYVQFYSFTLYLIVFHSCAYYQSDAFLQIKFATCYLKALNVYQCGFIRKLGIWFLLLLLLLLLSQKFQFYSCRVLQYILTLYHCPKSQLIQKRNSAPVNPNLGGGGGNFTPPSWFSLNNSKMVKAVTLEFHSIQ